MKKLARWFQKCTLGRKNNKKVSIFLIKSAAEVTHQSLLDWTWLMSSSMGTYCSSTVMVFQITYTSNISWIVSRAGSRPKVSWPRTVKSLIALLAVLTGLERIGNSSRLSQKAQKKLAWTEQAASTMTLRLRLDNCSQLRDRRSQGLKKSTKN